MTATSFPAVRGATAALLAAVLFGVTTPLVQRAGAHVGALTTGALLYAGAALAGALLRRPTAREAALRRSDLPRLALMAAFGAALGPVALAWGLQRTSATSGSLMLTLEASFTALLARMLYQESMDRRVWMAMGFLVLGSVMLVLDAGAAGGVSAIGLAAVLLATAAWGVDNAISRGLAERDPGQVVLAKASLGTMLTASGAFLLREPLPSPGAAAALLAIGASGYGLSLRFYLLAQRAFGAARTGSVFAFAPFIGAGVAMAIGDRSPDLLTAFAGALMLTGVVLHLAESHAHEHAHEALEHEHAHGHDDGHHAHPHDPMSSGPHSHWHRHEPVRHAHAHVPDAHHGHRH